MSSPLDEFVVFVTGSRDWSNPEIIDAELRKLVIPENKTPVLVHGGARGADSQAHSTSVSLGWKVRYYPITSSDWARGGKSEGPRRNLRMVKTERPHVALAFRLDDSRGTTNAIQVVTSYAEQLISRLVLFKIIDCRNGQYSEHIVVDKKNKK
jgi:hypothetical protein